MKTPFRLFIAALLVAASFTCCSKKDSGPQGSGNSFSFNGKNIKITRGDFYAAGDGTVQVALYTKEPLDIVIFGFNRLLNTGLDTIPVGTFTFENLDGQLHFPGDVHFFYGSLGGNEGEPLGYDYTSGVVNITKSGDSYHLSFDVTTEKGEGKGTFEGALPPR